MAAAAPGAYNVHIVPNAVEPPRPERPLPDPTFSRCTLETRWLSDQHGGNSARYDMIVETQSGKIWLLQRKIANALSGEVWSAVEVKIEDGEQYVEQYDADGRTRRVAVKRMPREKINTLIRRGGENPMKEIAALELVSDPGHPHVLRLDAALDDGDTVYLLSPFVDGGEVFAWIESNREPYGEARTATMRRLFRQLMQGLQYTHSKGICHADMSLENALVDMERRNVYIIDYGMSLLMPVVLIDGQYRRCKSIADGRKAKTSYCSPETFKNKGYDGVKVDVFAAGSMLFTMLTGYRPFTNASLFDHHFKQLVYRGDVEGTIRRLGVPPVGDQAVDLLKKMMAHRPDARPLPDEVLEHPWLTA